MKKRMKKNMILSLFASAIVLLTTSCSESEEMLTLTNQETVTFTARMDKELKTRVLDSNDEAVTRAVLEIYDTENNLVGSRVTGTINGDAISFTAPLERGRSYTCLFWADGGKQAYNIDNLTAISRGKNPSIAYYAKEDITVSGAETDITLRHAVAKLVIEELKTLNVGDKVGITFSMPAYTFNVSDGSCATEKDEDIAQEFIIANANTSGQIAALYLFTPPNGASPLTGTLSFTASGDSRKKTQDISNVPLKRNYRTILRGVFEELDANQIHQFHVNLEKNWAGDHSPYTWVLTHSGEINDSRELLDEYISPYGYLRIEGPMNFLDLNGIGYWTSASENVGKLKVLDISATTNLSDFDGKAFTRVKSFTSIFLPPNLRSITGHAFANSGLTSIEIPDNVTSIGMNAFQFCTDLKSVTLPANLEHIFDTTFTGCTSLSDITLPESMKTIGKVAFSQTALPGIRIPAQVTLIDKYAFVSTPLLKYMLIEGTRPLAIIASSSSERSEEFLSMVVSPFKETQEVPIFLPNITDKEVADTYGNGLLQEANPTGVSAIYYNYTGGADGDRTDPIHYTKWVE